MKYKGGCFSRGAHDPSPPTHETLGNISAWHPSLFLVFISALGRAERNAGTSYHSVVYGGGCIWEGVWAMELSLALLESLWGPQGTDDKLHQYSELLPDRSLSFQRSLLTTQYKTE